MTRSFLVHWYFSCWSAPQFPFLFTFSLLSSFFQPTSSTHHHPLLSTLPRSSFAFLLPSTTSTSYLHSTLSEAGLLASAPLQRCLPYRRRRAITLFFPDLPSSPPTFFCSFPLLPFSNAHPPLNNNYQKTTKQQQPSFFCPFGGKASLPR